MDCDDEIEVRCRCGYRGTWTRYHTDPPGAVRVETQSCPGCRRRDSREPVYYDAAGRELGRWLAS